MRVLFLIHELALNGAVVALLSQVRHLVETGARVSVLTPALDGSAAALREEFVSAGAELIGRTSTDEHDVAVGCTVFAAEALAGLVGRIPLVWWIHEGRAGMQHVLAHPKVAALLGAADKVVFPSRGTVERIWAPLLSSLPPEAVQRLYRSADVFALPSADESMPIAPIEAAWHGVPVVLSDLECYDGVWKHGVNALLHPVGEVELLAWYLRMLIASPAMGQKLAKAARAVVTGFGPTQTTSLFNAILEGVVAARARR